MKKKLFLGVFSLLSIPLFAQIPEDVLKYSWQPTNGTARVNAIGGAMGSLGGDISANFINPAGLGFYKTREIVLSPGFSFLKNKSNFRGTAASDKDSYFNLGTSGIVAGWQGNGRWSSKALSLGITRTANFSNKVFYTGENDFSSHGEQYAADAVNKGSIDDLPFNNTVAYGTRLAAWNYAIDTASIPGHAGQDIISMAMWNALKNGGDFRVNQSHSIETSGGITEIGLGYAANMDDKLYIGGSLGLPIVKYQKKSIFREEDATGNTDNNFNFNETTETFTTKGMGINAKFGIIAKPADFIRLGLAVHTPTWYSLEDTYDGSMLTDLENYRTTPGAIRVSLSDVLNAGEIPEYKYELISPWKFMLSGSYVLREAEDVRQQKGFITADVEYVTHKSNKFRNSEDIGNNSEYYNGVNNTIKDYYKGAFNFRVGGELKFTTLMTRLGFSYYGSPYSDKELKANKMFVSGGLGYRNAGIFIDLTYVHALQKDVDFPYRLPDKANTYATTKGGGGNLMLTFGFKI
ncbi:MAG: OmpP1/FadL family transporter [Chitinophagaceae bacterium]